MLYPHHLHQTSILISHLPPSPIQTLSPLLFPKYLIQFHNFVCQPSNMTLTFFDAHRVNTCESMIPVGEPDDAEERDEDEQIEESNGAFEGVGEHDEEELAG
jgi:hypothetical protein